MKVLAIGTAMSVFTIDASGPLPSCELRKSAHQMYSMPMTTAAR